MSKTQKIIAVAILLFAVFVPHSIVSANAAPSRSVIWFSFIHQAQTMPEIEKFTVWVCEDETCSSFSTIEQIPNSEPMDFDNELYCFDNWCRWQFYPKNEDAGIAMYSDKHLDPFYFRILVRFSDVERLSNILYGFPSEFGEVEYYNVEIRDKDLLLAFNESFQDPGLSGKFASYFLTLLLEPLSIFLFFTLVWKLNFSETFRVSVLAFIVNMISYPMIWTFFGSITKFHTEINTLWGFLFFFAGVIFSGLLFYSINTRSKLARKIFAWIISLLIFVSICMLALLASAYGNSKFVVSGFSVATAIFFIEIVSVCYEGLFLYYVNRKKMPFGMLMLGSLVMNMVSFVLGMVLLQ